MNILGRSEVTDVDAESPAFMEGFDTEVKKK